MKPLPCLQSIMFALLFGTQTAPAQQLRTMQVTTANGVVEGVVSADNKVRTFKGIPYAAPPVGPLRWRAPQPPASWTGVRKAVDYAPRAMQGRIYDDMIFHDTGPSEDCLYLNLWMPERPDSPAPPKLPVMVWIHGGGFIAGSSSEPRQDGGNLCKLGVMVVSMNYRMGVFGFFAHPELTKESGHDSSGNYGLMDQVAALQWVKANIAAFGGDPDNVTIFGESAGSFSVSALVASPLARGLFHRAIGESGALMSASSPPRSREDAEAAGVKFARSAFGTSSLADLRALPPQALLDAALKVPRNSFGPDVDGYFLPEDCRKIYAGGWQSHVPLLAGWNRDEGDYHSFFTNSLPAKPAGSSASTKGATTDTTTPTLENYAAHAKARFGIDAKQFLKVYAAANDAEVKRAAADFAGDKFIAFATWKWIDLHLKTGKSPVYRYEFDQTLPLAANARPGTEARAPHASDIEFVFRMLSSRRLPWRDEDRKVSELMAAYWTNFAKTGDPNGPGLPKWPQYDSRDGYQVMHLMTEAAPAPDAHRGRYLFLDHLGHEW